MSIEDMVTPEKITAVKSGVQASLSEHLPVSDEQINKIIDDNSIFTDEKIISYHEQIKNGKGIKFSDLMRDFGSIDPKNIL